MKILAVYREKLGAIRGTPIRVKTILSHLAKEKDIDLTVCSWDTEPIIDAKYIYLDNHHFRDAKKILRYVKENNIDIVIGHTLSSWYYLLAVKFFSRAKIMLEMHGFIEEEALLYGSIGKVRYYVEKFKYRLFFRSCDLITSCSETAAKIIKKYNDNSIAVFGSADLSLFNPEIPPGNFIKKDGRIVIGYVGNARIWQGVPFLVETYKELKKTHPEFKLAMVLSEKSAIHDPEVEYASPLLHEDVPKFLAECDILIIPRPNNEVNRISFPSKLPEYMAMGKPVISSNTGDADKVITDGIDGLLYETGDKDGLKKAIIFLSDKNARLKIGIAAAKTIREKFSWDVQCKYIENQLKKILINET